MIVSLCVNVFLLFRKKGLLFQLSSYSIHTISYHTHYIIQYYTKCMRSRSNIVTQKIKRLLFSHLHILFSFSLFFLFFFSRTLLFMCVFFLFGMPFLLTLSASLCVRIIEVDHTIILYLVDPNGEFIDYYGLGKAADEIVLSVKRNMDKWEKLHANTNWFQRLFS